MLSLCAWLEKNKGIRVHVIPVDRQGRLDIAAYRAALSDRVALVSMMWANNETGVINPVADLAELAKEVGALFHTDAVQAVGKCPIDLQSTAIDMLSLSGHKLHGPKGIGALYVRNGVRFKPQIKGGQQERGRRAGTENVPGIVGLGMAAELAAAAMADEDIRVRGLRDRLEREILAQVDHCVAVGARAERLPNTSNIAFSFIDSEAIVTLLDRAGIAASMGSACSTGSFEPSHVLVAMKVAEDAVRGGVRFSLSRDNTDADIDRALDGHSRRDREAARDLAVRCRGGSAAGARAVPMLELTAPANPRQPAACRRSCSTTPRCATASRRRASPSPPPRRSRSPARLARAGVPEIEAGTPAMGADEIAAIRAIVEAGLPLTTIAWCRMRTEDVDAALASGVSMVNVSVPVSDVQIAAKLGGKRIATRSRRSSAWSAMRATRVSTSRSAARIRRAPIRSFSSK